MARAKLPKIPYQDENLRNPSSEYTEEAIEKTSAFLLTIPLIRVLKSVM